MHSGYNTIRHTIEHDEIFHTQRYNKGYNHKKYQYIRENGGWENWSMILIEKYPCNNKLELEKREDEIMCEMQSKLNAQRASRNKKEYYEDNKEKIKEQQKEYGSKKVMCECGCEVRRDYLARHKRRTKHINFINQFPS